MKVIKLEVSEENEGPEDVALQKQLQEEKYLEEKNAYLIPWAKAQLTYLSTACAQHAEAREASLATAHARAKADRSPLLVFFFLSSLFFFLDVECTQTV